MLINLRFRPLICGHEFFQYCLPVCTLRNELTLSSLCNRDKHFLLILLNLCTLEFIPQKSRQAILIATEAGLCLISIKCCKSMNKVSWESKLERN